jgi:hypothetical protein
MAISLGNRAKMSTSTTGTGTITLGSAESGYQTFAAAGITNGQTVRYVVEDGSDFEIGSGTYTSSGTTLTRSVTESSNSDNAIVLSGGAKVFLAATVADLYINDGASTLTTTGVITGGTVEATSDTAAGDNAAMGYTSAEGLILTGQGSTNDITIKNDADTAVISIPTGGTNVDFVGSIDVANVGISTGVIDLKNGGSQSVVKFYCESSNAHYAQIQAPAHGSFSGNVTLTLPATTDTIAGIAATQTFTNKTLTSPKINENVAVTTTATEINLIDGGTSRGTTAVASGDGILINDAGTMRMTNVDTVSTYFSGHSVGGGNIVTTGALNSGSITSGFGAINNGASNITTTGVGAFGSLDISGDIDVDGTTNLDAVDIDGAVQLDATLTVGANDQGYDVTLHGDTAARNVVWDSSADSLIFSDNAKAMFGASSDLQIYHDGSHSYIKDNGTGDLILQGSDQVKIQTITGETMVSTNENNAVVLYYDNATKLATTSTGVEVTGAATVGGAAVKVAGLETIWVPATAMYPATTNGSSALTQVETTALRPDLMVLDFAAAADDFAQFSVGFPKSWNEGTVTFQVFWTPSNTNTDDCIWSLQGVSVADGATIDVAYGTAVSVTDAGIGTVEDQQVSPVSGAVTITNAAVDTQTYFQIFRDGNAAGDDFSGVARLLGVKIFFTTDAANDA